MDKGGGGDTHTTCMSVSGLSLDAVSLLTDVCTLRGVGILAVINTVSMSVRVPHSCGATCAPAPTMFQMDERTCAHCSHT